MYRQKKYDLGAYLEVEIFPFDENLRTYERARKTKESSPAQKKLNNKKSQRHFNRLVHTNFRQGDLFIDLTFDEKNIPENRQGVIRCVKNYIARLKRYRKKHNMPELKYIYVVSNSDEFGNKKRLHAHMIINAMDRDIAEELWGHGYCNTDKLQFNEYGVTGKVLYMARQAKGERTWAASRNLKKVSVVTSDKAITKAKAEKIERNPEDRSFFEKLYPGWTFTDCVVEYQDDEGLKRGSSFFIRMRKEVKRNENKRRINEHGRKLQKQSHGTLEHAARCV